MHTQPETLSQIPLNKIDGTETSLAAYAGKVLLIVNVASECGLTPQYAGLEALYQKYREQGLLVLGFPANEFGAQEPGSNAEIQSFCSSKFGVHFPLFEKIVVKGEGIHPLYQHLTQAIPEADDLGDASFADKLAEYGVKKEKASDIFWNFEKFLINRQGEIVARFAPSVTPEQPALIERIEAELSKS